MGNPAAKQNDMIVGVDTHIIMIPTPGGPVPTPLPHPFMGMLDTSLSTDVKIDGMFAAVVGSIANAKPPHIPQGGPFQVPPTNQGKIEMGSSSVFVNGKPLARMGDMATTCNDLGMMMHSKVIVPFSTVLVGGAPTPAGSGASGSTGGASGSGGSQAETQSESGSSESETADQFVEFEVKDSAGEAASGAEYELVLPTGEKKTGTVGSDGKVREEGLPAGNAILRLKGLHEPMWTVDVAAPGEQVEVKVTGALLDDKNVKFEIFRIGQEGSGDAVDTLTSRIADGEAKAKWTYQYDEKDKGRAPRYVFHAHCEGFRTVSAPLRVGDTFEATVEDTEGRLLTGQKYELFACDGEARQGTTGADAKIVEKGLAFGKCVLRLGDGTVVREVS